VATTPVVATTDQPTQRLELRNTPELDDAVRGAAAGDGAALRRLYDVLAPKIVGYLRMRGAEDPEGLTNDVFLTVFSRLDRLTGGWQGFRAFAFTVAHSRVVDDLRRQARTPRHDEYDAEHDGRTDESAEQQALAGMDDGEASQLLALLPEEQRTVVILRILGDLSTAQTALVLRTTEARVKKLQQRAVLALRGLIGSEPKDLDEVGR
jgi:RNA polymerase sigma-70 factor (ECF subfamily)